MVINNISEVISWIAVRFDENLIIEDIVIKDDTPMYHVLPFTRSVWDQHSDHMRLTTLDSLFDFTFT
jgi:hypothetical protein